MIASRVTSRWSDIKDTAGLIRVIRWIRDTLSFTLVDAFDPAYTDALRYNPKTTNGQLVDAFDPAHTIYLFFTHRQNTWYKFHIAVTKYIRVFEHHSMMI